MMQGDKNGGARPEAWLLGQARAVGRPLVSAGAWALAGGLLSILQAWLLAQACHRVIMDGAGLSAILPLATAVALLALVRGGLVLLAERQAAAAAARVKQSVRTGLYRRLLAMGPAGRSGKETGLLVEAVTTGIEGLEPYVSRFIPQLALAALLPAAVLAVILPAEWRAGLVLLFSAPFIPLFMVLVGRNAERLNRRQWTQLARMAGHLLDLVQGLPDLKIFAAAKREADSVARVSADYRRATMAVLRVAFLSAFTLEFFATVGTAVVAVTVGFRLLGGHLPLADGLFVLLLAPEFYLPLRTLGLTYHARLQGVAAAEQIMSLLACLVPDESAGQLPVLPGAPTIRFEGVTFCYGTDRGGVAEIDLELPAGSLTALAGESGTGKTTLMRLLTGLVRPEKGRITVNGVDLAAYDPAAWRAALAWVPQQPFLFTGTVRENLLLGRPDATAVQLHAALAAAAAADFIGRLPDGLDTWLGDRGAGLSGGEQRRLALARAFLRDARLVVLDEPTAGLDPESERLVGEALERLSRGRTVLVISHREETIRRTAQVAVLTGGRLERVVAPAEFLAELAGGAA